MFLSEKFGRPSFERVLAQLDVYRSRIVNAGHLKPLLWREQVQEMRQRKTERYGVLSLEGVDGLEGNLYYVQLLFDMGVRLMGLPGIMPTGRRMACWSSEMAGLRNGDVS